MLFSKKIDWKSYMMSGGFESIIKEPDHGEANACVIWLHGLGADGYDFVDIVPSLRINKTYKIRYIFPHAPVRPVTIQGGLPCRAWFDIFQIDRLALEDKSGIIQSTQSLIAMIDQQVKIGIPHKKIVLVGFSQGGALAQYAAMHIGHQLAGVAGLSAYLPLQDHISQDDLSKELPVFLAHGTYDPVVPCELGKSGIPLWKSLNCSVDWYEYPIEHTVCPEELEDLSQWINGILTK
tara:strand:+ start:2011 stop:2718 length:708 start_codon:yes stop_codon:yes gene_type:complete